MAIDYLQKKLVQAQPSSESAQTGQPEQVTPYGDFLPIFPLSFLIIWGVAAWIFLDIPKLLGKGASLQRKRYKFPCQNCQYYTDNPYIKCAVHPTIAMTEAAKDCSDHTNHSL
jgi:hypothetical protein